MEACHCSSISRTSDAPTPKTRIHIYWNERGGIMLRSVHRLLFTASLLLFAAFAFAEQLDVNTILTKQKAGASADALLAAVNDPANAIAIKAEDIALLRSGGVPEPVIAAIQQRITSQAAAPAPIAPDDVRLTDVVRIVKSGISE